MLAQTVTRLGVRCGSRAASVCPPTERLLCRRRVLRRARHRRSPNLPAGNCSASATLHVSSVCGVLNFSVRPLSRLHASLVAFVSLLLLSKFSVLKLHIEGCLFDLLGTISTTPCTDSLTRCSSRDGHLALWQSPSDCLQPQSASRADNTNFAIRCQDGPGCSVRRARKTTPLLSPRRLRHAAASLVKDFKSS